MSSRANAVTTVPKYPVIGVGISLATYGEVEQAVRTWLTPNGLPQRERAARYVCVTTANGIITAHRDPSFRLVLNNADVVTPDGMPLVWALRSFGFPEQRRVYGPTLTLRLCEQAASEGHRVFFFGGKPEVLDQLCHRLQERFPALQIAGAYSPPFRSATTQEKDEQMRMILDAGTDLLFVGLGEPKQERWMAEHRDDLPGVVMVGVGAAFDFHAGTLRQAPPWMQNAGLEWLFRLYMEPRRLWRRYILTTPLFLPLWAAQRFGWLRSSQR